MTLILPPFDQKILVGLPGAVVDLFAKHTEAHPLPIALQFLVAFGNAVGRGPTVMVGETRHHLNEFVGIVGRSSHARKGDSKNAALRTPVEADPDWAASITGGLSTGQGLIHVIRDATVKVNKNTGETYVADPGVSDKRLLVTESEFSGALKQFRRPGNTLSNVLRDAWDSKMVLKTITKHSATQATAAHISVIAHTTLEDLHEHLTNTEAANGLGNRFLFALTHRVHLLPNPGCPDPSKIANLVDLVRNTLTWARQVTEIRRTPEAEALWCKVYPSLAGERPGLLGKLLARAEAHVLRLSALYALCAHADTIDVSHLESALAMWDYIEASTRLIFAGRTGDKIADRILAGLPPGHSLSVTDLRKQVFANHISKGQLGAAIKLLIDLREIEVHTEGTKGRKRQMVTRLGTPLPATDDEEAAAHAS